MIVELREITQNAYFKVMEDVRYVKKLLYVMKLNLRIYQRQKNGE